MSRVLDAAEIAVDRGPFEMIPHWLLESEVSAVAIRLYLVLRQHGDAKAICYPGRKRLAQALRTGVKSVDRAKDELVAVGAICYTRRHSESGDWTSNLYHVHWDPSLACVTFDPRWGQNEPYGRVKNDPTGSVKNDTRTKTHSEPRPNEPKQELFDEFWRTYPRKANKGRARTAWKSAVGKADPRTIIEGAERYRDDPNRTDEFTAHASSWLNGERWLDDPLPSRGSKSTDRLKRNLEALSGIEVNERELSPLEVEYLRTQGRELEA